MPQSNVNAVNNDIDSLNNDTRNLVNDAAVAANQKAAELRSKGKDLLDSTLTKAHEVHSNALKAGKEIAVSAEGYVKENPWRTIAFSAGIGLLLGVILGRK